MSNTKKEFEAELAVCRKLFEMKTRDYGTSWRILRLPSLTDQIFIKANRIRSVQMCGEAKIDENIEDCFVAMVNYSVMALIQCELGLDGEQDLPLERAMELYDKHSIGAMNLMLDKNHDYGEAWRSMRVSSMVDIILMKLKRLKQIEDNNGRTLVSEGVEGSYNDILNYSVFSLIQMHEEEQQ
ncbi:MAG: DUF1599 domain-containing protein [Bacteroidales bacterium]|nr:DUF1599 domain-containing protein [Bacteroidales bacterium]